MNFFSKLFNKKNTPSKEVREQKVNLSLDDSFVHNFLERGGKFLYCITQEEVKKNLLKILKENNWDKIICIDENLKKIVDNTNTTVSNNLNKVLPFFTKCEHLIAKKGEIIFSSNQIRSSRLNSLSENFIVYATTSQLVKNTGDALTGIKLNSKDIPTNISAIKNYKPTNNQEDNNFLSYGNSNSKNLYLLLFEDL